LRILNKANKDKTDWWNAMEAFGFGSARAM